MVPGSRPGRHVREAEWEISATGRTPPVDSYPCPDYGDILPMTITTFAMNHGTHQTYAFPAKAGAGCERLEIQY